MTWLLGGDSACLAAYQVGLFPQLPPKVWWFPAYLPQPKGPKQCHCLRALQGPTLEEISQWLNGATCFSKLDAKDGFWIIHPDEKSSYLTTFNTHHGRNCFLCMPFYLKMSHDIFQMHMDQVTDGLPNIIAIHDDICIYSLTLEEHDWHLLKLIQTAAWHNWSTQDELSIEAGILLKGHHICIPP